MLLPSLHLMVVHPPTKPRVGGIASGASLNNPEVAQAVRSSATNLPSSTCHSHPMGTRNPQYTAHKREPAGAAKEIEAVGGEGGRVQGGGPETGPERSTQRLRHRRDSPGLLPRHVPPELAPPQRSSMPRNRTVRLFYKESSSNTCSTERICGTRPMAAG